MNRKIQLLALTTAVFAGLAMAMIMPAPTAPASALSVQDGPVTLGACERIACEAA